MIFSTFIVDIDPKFMVYRSGIQVPDRATPGLPRICMYEVYVVSHNEINKVVLHITEFAKHKKHVIEVSHAVVDKLLMELKMNEGDIGAADIISLLKNKLYFSISGDVYLG